MSSKSIRQEELKSLLHYSPETGFFTRLTPTQRTKVGEVIGCKNTNGHVQIRLGRRFILAHRLAWLYMTGSFPQSQVDHINGIKDDNRWINLREATNKQNGENQKLHTNNTSGYRGVHFDKKTRKWRGVIGHNGKKLVVGYFCCASEAAAATKEARAKFYTHDYGRDSINLNKERT
jgi:hypothetical protein